MARVTQRILRENVEIINNRLAADPRTHERETHHEHTQRVKPTVPCAAWPFFRALVMHQMVYDPLAQKG